MDVGAFLRTFIYLISSSLLYPVLFLLSVLVVWLILYAGGFFAEWLERARMQRVPSERLPERIRREPTGPFLSHRVRAYIGRLQKILLDASGGEEAVENLLQETTLKIRKSLDRLRILVRVAPGLGLIGTLIPMGTGLAALGQGDMSKLTSDLVIAFTTTVVGIALGLAAFFFLTIKSRWVEEDLKNIELATEVLSRSSHAELQESLRNDVREHTERERMQDQPVQFSWNR
jgi:biopolymer transport protein ExbB/TolQ